MTLWMGPSGLGEQNQASCRSPSGRTGTDASHRKRKTSGSGATPHRSLGQKQTTLVWFRWRRWLSSKTYPDHGQQGLVQLSRRWQTPGCNQTRPRVVRMQPWTPPVTASHK
jgi:hypothetical protein